MDKLSTLELLPNEILIECFEYLNAFEIFYSFDQLNYRFNKLIRNIPLYLNFENVRKSIFDQFCMKMKLNPEILAQIYSLKLSNINRCHQIETFLSFFSIDEFLHLRSFTLSSPNKDTVEQLKLMLPLLSELYAFHVFNCKYEEDTILNALPMSKLKILSISRARSLFTLNDKILPIRSLTASTSSFIKLPQIFKYVPMLKYLHIQSVYNDYDLWNNDWNYQAIHLKQLVFDDFTSKFNDLEKFLKQTPNLRNLRIAANNNEDMIDAYRWEDLIKSSLIYLKIFKFRFCCCSSTEGNLIAEKFQQFQTSFWHKEHHWYTGYTLHTQPALIYTTPYISKTYKLRSNTQRYSNKFVNNSHTFDNVIDLWLSYEAIREECSYYFCNITSLTIVCQYGDRVVHNGFLTKEHIQYLKTIINLSNLKHIDFSGDCRIETSRVLFEILQEAPQLSSITIDISQLISFFDDDELCKYLNKMIKKFTVPDTSFCPFKNLNELTKFCQMFSNLEQLTYKTKQSDDIFYILNHLPKLIILTIYVTLAGDSKSSFSRFEDEAKKQNIMFHIEPVFPCEQMLQIWTG